MRDNRQRALYNHYPQGREFFLDGNKKHYREPVTEIQAENIFADADPNHHITDNRILDPSDIEGATPGSLVSKVLKNKKKAEQLRRDSPQKMVFQTPVPQSTLNKQLLNRMQDKHFVPRHQIYQREKTPLVDASRLAVRNQQPQKIRPQKIRPIAHHDISFQQQFQPQAYRGSFYAEHAKPILMPAQPKIPSHQQIPEHWEKPQTPLVSRQRAEEQERKAYMRQFQQFKLQQQSHAPHPQSTQPQHKQLSYQPTFQRHFQSYIHPIAKDPYQHEKAHQKVPQHHSTTKGQYSRQQQPYSQQQPTRAQRQRASFQQQYNNFVNKQAHRRLNPTFLSFQSNFNPFNLAGSHLLHR